jgi:hypothetical protein
MKRHEAKACGKNTLCFYKMPLPLNIKDTLIFKNGEGDLNYKDWMDTEAHKEIKRK